MLHTPTTPLHHSPSASSGLPSSSLPRLPSSSPLPHPSLPVLSLPGDSDRTSSTGAALVEHLVLEGDCSRWDRSEESGGGGEVSGASDDGGVRAGVGVFGQSRSVASAAACERPGLHKISFASKRLRSESAASDGGGDTLFPPEESVEHVPEGRRPQDVVVVSSSPRKASSSWSACGSRDRDTTWNPPAGSGEKTPAAQRRPRSSGVRGHSGGRGQPGGMSLVSVRRCRQWLGVGLPLTVFLYVLLCCNSALWSSLHLQQVPLPNTLPGSGFRKLLEEQEKGRLAVNLSLAGLTQRLPSCIIIGVRKCGTRALLEFLDLHPDIVTAEDEMHFFNDDERYRLGLEWYRHLMPPSLPHQITMEKTPGYFISPIAPSRVHRMNSSVKLLVLLRHPTTRTISDYTQIFYNKMSKNESLDAFENIVIDRDTGAVNTRYKAVQISMYHHHFRHWTDVFPLQQIHVVDGDRLITDPVSEIREIENFLGLEHRIDYNLLYYNSTRGFYCMHINATYEKCLGASKGRKHPDIQVPVIRKLNKFFQPHNEELFDMIDRKFPWS